MTKEETVRKAQTQVLAFVKRSISELTDSAMEDGTVRFKFSREISLPELAEELDKDIRGVPGLEHVIVGVSSSSNDPLEATVNFILPRE